MKVEDIIYEEGHAWILKDIARRSYTVFCAGVTHSTSDSAYAMTEDRLIVCLNRSLAIWAIVCSKTVKNGWPK